MNLVLVRGLPGSGKSTMAKRLAQANSSLHIEADMYFLDKEGNYNYNSSTIKEAHSWCQKETKKMLKQGLTVIVSNTFTTAWEMKPYFSIARELGIIPQVILCQNTFNNVHNVPEETLEKMKNRFEFDISKLFEVEDELV